MPILPVMFFVLDVLQPTKILSAQVLPPESHEIALGTSPSLAIDAKNCLHVMFEGAQADVFSCASFDRGKTWTEPVNVSNSPGISTQPEIIVEKSGALDVAWRELTVGEHNPDIFFSRSTDGGKIWSKPVDVSNSPGVSSQPALACASDDSIHLVWSDTSKGRKNQEIYYSYSKDGGQTWGKDSLMPAEDVSNTLGASSEPRIGIGADDIVHIVWTDSTSGKLRPDIFYTSKINDKFIKPIDLSDNTRVSAHPDIAMGPNSKVYLAWSDTSSELHLADVWYSVSENGQFAKAQNVSNTAGVSTQPVVAADETGRFVVAWSDTNIDNSRPEIYARVSHNKGATLSHIIDISNTQGGSKHARLAISQDRFYVVWEEDAGAVATKVMVRAVEF
jgi:hypothetical protein